MRAVRLAAARRLEVVDVPEPVPGAGEVVVRVAAAGICGSDLSCYKSGVFSGSVLGHEMGGLVEATGPGVTGWRPGEPVAVDPKIPCGVCGDCRSGAQHRCVEALTRGPGAMRDGAFAELVAVPAHGLFRLPEEVAPEDACLVEPFSVAIHGLERAGIRPGEAAVVIGLGPIGLLAIAALRARDAGAVTGVDPSEPRRRLAATLGADRVAANVAGLGGARAPLVLECSGREDMVQEAVNLAEAGGRVALLGVSMHQATIVPMVLVTREISVFGSISSTAEDFRTAIALLARRPEIAGIITKRVPLDELPDAFASLVDDPTEGKIAADPRLGSSQGVG